MNDIEKKAEEWADERCPEQGPEFIVWTMCKEDFLAGARAERRELLEWLDARIREPGYVNFDIHGQILMQLKQKLEAKAK